MSEERSASTKGELSSEEKRANVVRLAFDGSEERFNEFVEVVRQAIPPGVGVVLRGSGLARWRMNS